MAAHLRTQIRQAIHEIVLGLPSVGQNVFLSRRVPLAEEHIPAICIYTLSEESGPDTMGGSRRMRRILDVGVECLTFDTDALDDELDQMAYEVEEAIATDYTLGGLVYDTIITNTRVVLQPTRAGERPIGAALLAFRVTYRASFDDPSIN